MCFFFNLPLLLAIKSLNTVHLLLFSCSVVSNSVIPWTTEHQASLSFTIFQSLLRLMAIEFVMPSNQLIVVPFAPTFNLSQRQHISNESVLHIRWPTYWSFSFSISPFNENSGLISFWIDILAINSK